jgi:hypothetical protein
MPDANSKTLQEWKSSSLVLGARAVRSVLSPAPLIVRVNPGFAVVEGLVAAGVKMMLLTSVFAETETSVVCERPNLAISAGPFGTPIGVQLAGVFQSPEGGIEIPLGTVRVGNGWKASESSGSLKG